MESGSFNNNMTMIMIEMPLVKDDPERVLSGPCAACGGGVGGDGGLVPPSLRALCCVYLESPQQRSCSAFTSQSQDLNLSLSDFPGL